MSTKCTLAYGSDFHLYHEWPDDDHVYIQLDTTHFEASYGRVTVEIPIHIWEVIRRRGGADLSLADKSDAELRQIVEGNVDERIRRYEDRVAKGENEPALAFLLHSFAYGRADTPRDEQVAIGMEHHLERRRRQQEIRARIKDMEGEQSPYCDEQDPS